MSKNKFYSPEKIDKTNAEYRLIIGERSNGKTYSILLKILKNYWKTGKQGAYIRRWAEDIRGFRGDSLFSPLVENNEIEKITRGQYTEVIYKKRAWYLAFRDEDGEKHLQDKPFCYAFALTEMEHSKGTSFPEVTIICFDEFLTRSMYLPDEFVLYNNVLSTIIRQRDDAIIYMLANTVSTVSPYFNEYGLNHVKEMKPGNIDVYLYGDSVLKLAIEMTEPNIEGKPSDKYFAFDNPKLKMITQGSWEIAVYPHCPIKYEDSNICMRFIIDFNNELLMGELVNLDVNFFVFIHRKTTPVKSEDTDIVFSDKFSPKKNWIRNILKLRYPFQQTLMRLYESDKFFYQDNSTGEIFRNYIMFCKSLSITIK